MKIIKSILFNFVTIFCIISLLYILDNVLYIRNYCYGYNNNTLAYILLGVYTLFVLVLNIVYIIRNQKNEKLKK